MKMLLRSFCLPVLLLVLCSTAHSQALFFQPPTYPGSGQTVTADVNGDGRPDLVSADGTVLLGKGDGTFTVGTPLSVGGQNAANVIATGDFNGDGKTDLLLMSPSSTVLNILLGNGDGTFQPALTMNIGASLDSIVVADFNGDGKLDVAGVSLGTGLFVFLGNGNGTFAQAPGSPAPFPTTTTSLLVVGDFNGDGKLDIAFGSSSNTTAGPGGVFLGKGDGSFQPVISLSTGMNSVIAIVAKDFNGDGKLDLAVSGDTGSVSETFILLGNGDGTFQPPGSPLPMSGYLAVADLNGDGKPDVVIGGDPFVEVFLGKGDGTFSLQDTYYKEGTLGISRSTLIADFNGDGKLDVAVENVMLFGNGDGSLQGNDATPIGPALVAGDFNGDGSTDALVSVGSTNNNVAVLLNDGTGKLILAHTYALPPQLGPAATAELNHDGKLDVLLTAVDSSSGTPVFSLSIMLGNGDGTFSAPSVVIPAMPGGVTTAGIGDFNGDHIPDLAVFSPQGVTIFLGKGDGTFSSPVNYFAGSNPNSLLIADFNNDGNADIAVGSAAGIGILLGKGDGTFQPASFSSSGTMEVAAAADLNGDGKVDLITGGGSIGALLGNGDGTFGNESLFPSPEVFGSITVADVNGDGKPDLVVGPGLLVFLGNGDGTFANPISIVSGSRVFGPNWAVVADFNGDHRPDVLLSTRSDQAEIGVVTLINVSGPAVPDFAISASPASPESIVAGSTATTTVTLAPANGFSATVTLSCSGLPTGASCSFTPPAIPGGSGTSTVTFATGTSTPAGTYFVSIVGTSATRTHATLKMLTVTSATPPDFSLAPASTATATVTAGKTATYLLSLAAAGGFSGNVALSCSGAPATTTCSISPATVSVGGATAATATVTVTTTARSEVPLPVGNDLLRQFRGRPTMLLAALMAMLILAWICTTRKNQRLRWAPVLTMALLMCAGLTLTSCGGGSSGGGGGTVPTGTQAGTYTITVSATATAGSTTLSHSAKLTLIVQ